MNNSLINYLQIWLMTCPCLFSYPRLQTAENSKELEINIKIIYTVSIRGMPFQIALHWDSVYFSIEGFGNMLDENKIV